LDVEQKVWKNESGITPLLLCCRFSSERRRRRCFSTTHPPGENRRFLSGVAHEILNYRPDLACRACVVDARRTAAAGKSIYINGTQVHHDVMRPGHVKFESYMIFYSRTQPWSSLSLLRRAARVCMRINEQLTELRPTDVEIESVESVIEGKLPADYKAFLKANNGGRPEPSVFSFKEHEKMSLTSVHYFFALHSGKIGNLMTRFATLRQRVPLGFLPIATDPLGNLILIGCSSSRLGKIYFWDHEKESEELPSLKNIWLVASSFTEFIESLENRP
jgi:hypothetical protein